MLCLGIVEPFSRLESTPDHDGQSLPGLRVGPAFINPNSSEVVDAIVSTVESSRLDGAGPSIEEWYHTHVWIRCRQWILPLMTLCEAYVCVSSLLLSELPSKPRTIVLKSIPVIALGAGLSLILMEVVWNDDALVNLPSSINISFGPRSAFPPDEPDRRFFSD